MQTKKNYIKQSIDQPCNVKNCLKCSTKISFSFKFSVSNFDCFFFFFVSMVTLCIPFCYFVSFFSKTGFPFNQTLFVHRDFDYCKRFSQKQKELNQMETHQTNEYMWIIHPSKFTQIFRNHVHFRYTRQYRVAADHRPIQNSFFRMAMLFLVFIFLTNLTLLLLQCHFSHVRNQRTFLLLLTEWA